MSAQPSLFGSPPAVHDDEGVRVAYALMDDRPVHVGALEHYRERDRRRPELTCLGCDKRVHPVFPGYGRRSHFRHVEASPECTARGGDGARAWNVKAMLYTALLDAPSAWLTRYCQHARNPWLTTPPLARSAACDRERRRRVPAFDRVTLERHPHEGDVRRPDLVLLDGERPVFLLFVGEAHAVAHAHARSLRRQRLPWLELEVSDQSYPRLARWTAAREPELPWTRIADELAWSCPEHRGYPPETGDS